MKKILSILMVSLIVLSTLSIVVQTKADPELGTWVSKANMLQPRKDMAAVTLNGEIYVIGGSDRSGGGTERPTSIVEIYDPATDSWTTGPPLPAPKRFAGAVVIDNKIYVVGGDNRTFCYDSLSGWTELAQIPIESTSSAFAVGAVDGRMYMAYGEKGYPSKSGWTYCYDPANDTWIPKASLPYHRTIESFAELDGKLYAIGGGDPSLGARIETNQVDIYDPATDTWQIDAIPRMSVHRGHLEPTTPVVNGKIYVIGGWDGYRALSSVEEYNPVSNSWKTLASMPTDRYALATAVVNGKIYAMGGGAGGLGQYIFSVNEEFTPPDIEPPLITILSPQNTTYTTTSVPLTFTVKEPTSWIGYSLDNQANVTIAGNTTLIGLAEGSHSIVVYANDTSGNMGSSETVYFTITLKTLLGTGWGWMRIDLNESVCGRAELYKIGDTQIELAITCEGETYSRTWKIILHKEYKHGERYLCYSREWGFVIVGFHKHRWQFWWAIGKGVAAFGFPNLGTPKLTPTPV